MNDRQTPSTDGAGAQAVDLTNCDREPIHLLGRVQSYGALVAVSSDWMIQQVSQNVSDILGITPEKALGAPLNTLIVSDGFDQLRRALSKVGAGDSAVRLFDVTVLAGKPSFDINMHQSGAYLMIEFEPRAGVARQDVLSQVYPYIAGLRKEADLDTLAEDAAHALQSLTGFDSVMVYQFQPDASGKVLAEARSDGQEKYLGLMFPASDIPVQARALYKRSLLRLIADVNDEGSPVMPGTDLDGKPVDLSLAVTRSVSPIHIEYLKNMGVEASMSVSIMRNGELWGLFACHHHTPLYIDYQRRTMVELFAHMFSYELGNFSERQRKKAQADTTRLQTLLMGHMAAGSAVAESLLAVSRDIRRVIPHDGLVLFENEVFNATGATPSEDEFRSFARMLDRAIGSANFQTDCMGRAHQPAMAYENRIAGALAIPISKRPRDYLVLFRKPVDDTVKWAGNPQKPVEVGPNGIRLTPRQSFEVWRETVVGRSTPWSGEEQLAADLLRTVLLEVFLKVTDAANLERQRAQEQQTLLISELNHRVRNILNLMRGLLSQSRSSARSLEEFTSNLDGRIHALGRAHDQLTAEQWEPASLKALVRCEFEAYSDEKSDRVLVEGPDALISPQAYTTLALVLHEMATNSLKYGALCDQSGKLRVKLSVDASGGVLLDWTERGGPPVTPPKRRGFGSTVIEQSIPHELRGDAQIWYKVTGVEARFRLPPTVISQIVEEKDDWAKPAPAPAAKADGAKFTGRALVLEDTLIIAMDAAGILEDLGASEVKIVSTVKAALQWLETNSVDFALLDVNLGDEQSLPVAEVLAAKGVPFVVATGYGASEDLAQVYPPCVFLQKPFSATSVEGALRRSITL